MSDNLEWVAKWHDGQAAHGGAGQEMHEFAASACRDADHKLQAAMTILHKHKHHWADGRPIYECYHTGSLAISLWHLCEKLYTGANGGSKKATELLFGNRVRLC